MNAPESLAQPLTLDEENIPASARIVLSLLKNIRVGQLTLTTPEGNILFFGHDPDFHAAITIYDWSVCGRSLKSGDIGFSECYVEGLWDSPDIARLLRVLVRNQDILEEAIFGHWWGRLFYRLKHALNRNTRRNSQKNIEAHYDLGNDFYTLWLDPTMNYSSAWFNQDFTQSLEEAQHRKVQRALEMCGVEPNDRVLEIGFGWGALAEKATGAFQARMTGVTLSKEQWAFAQNRLRQQGLSARADLRIQDYRDISDAPFDAICSIEMIEAVGREYWPVYFKTLHRLLKPGKRACIQAIVIREDQFDRYISGTDFIQQYIFPGGCLLSVPHVEKEARRAGLKIVDQFSMGQDYAETLKRWRETFMSRLDEVRALGYDTRFIRLWECYLAYCEAGFKEGNTDVIQFTFERPL